MKLRLLTVCCVLVLSVASPVAAAAICGAILVLQIGLMGIRPAISCLPAPSFRVRIDHTLPVFSIHVATHSEPPAMVLRTLRALLAQNWPGARYEIIVMDNNTADAALWKPVEAFCRRQGAHCRFLHKDRVAGAKAGALNIALEHTRADASHIITVDADYVVGPQFLDIAASALRRTGADYVQFPQSYAGVTGTAIGVDAELQEYFRSNAAVADEAEAVLLTGTLCVISKDALIAAGKWSGATTTEDAEMGVRLCNAGFTGRFINRVVGQGLLPFSLIDLERQRYRWCSGNLQTLLRHFRTIFTPAGSLSLRKRLVVVSQLTAWFNLAFVPAIVMLALLFLGREDGIAAVLAASVILLSFLDMTIRVMGRGLRDGLEPGVMVQAFLCRLALAPQSARATFDAMVGAKLEFIVTDKCGADLVPRIGLPIPQTGLFAVSLFVLIGAAPSHPVIVAALLILMAPLPAALLTGNSLIAYRKSIQRSRQEVPA